MKKLAAPKRPAAPAHLSKAAKALWVEINADFVLDAAALSILTVALQAFDRAEEAREIVSKEGLVVKDRWQQTKAHPALVVERDSRAAYLAGLRQLGLDLIPPGGK